MTVSDMEPEGVHHLLERDTSTQLGIFRMLLWFRKFQRHFNYSALPIAQNDQ